MQHRQNFRRLLKAGLACSALLSAGCSSVFGDRTPPAVPQATLPCSLPYQEKARELPPQQDLDKPLPGDRWAELGAADAKAYNLLFPKFNANIDWAGENCVARKSPAK